MGSCWGWGLWPSYVPLVQGQSSLCHPHPAQQVTAAEKGAGGISEQAHVGLWPFPHICPSLSDPSESLGVLPPATPCPHRDVPTGTATQQQPLCGQWVRVHSAPTPAVHTGLLEASGFGSHAMGRASLGQPDRGYQSWTAVRRVPSPRQRRSPSDGCLPVTRRLAMGDFSQLWMKR